MDVIAMRAAREGSLAGFDGRVIYVRSAGEDAWQGSGFKGLGFRV